MYKITKAADQTNVFYVMLTDSRKIFLVNGQYKQQLAITAETEAQVLESLKVPFFSIVSEAKALYIDPKV